LESDEILTDITAEVSEQVRCSKPPLQLENQNTSSIPQVYQTVSDIVVTDGSSLNIRWYIWVCTHGFIEPVLVHSM